MLQSKIVLPSTGIPSDIFPLLNALASVASNLKRTIERGFEDVTLPLETTHNMDGDEQEPLDLIADRAFFEAIGETNVRWYASEERGNVQCVDQNGIFALAINPLDGSSNIDVNAPLGTIFSVFPTVDDPDKSFLRLASQQSAAGYFFYRPQTIFMLTHGSGVSKYVLNPDTKTFVQTRDRVNIPKQSTEFAINMSNYRHWSKPFQVFVDDCIAGEGGPRAKDFNMRWIASLVAEAHRILTRGGVFLYPNDSRNGYKSGRLRMVYECPNCVFDRTSRRRSHRWQPAGSFVQSK